MIFLPRSSAEYQWLLKHADGKQRFAPDPGVCLDCGSPDDRREPRRCTECGGPVVRLPATEDAPREP